MIIASRVLAGVGVLGREALDGRVAPVDGAISGVDHPIGASVHWPRISDGVRFQKVRIGVRTGHREGPDQETNKTW